MRVRTLKIVLAVSVALNVFALAGAGDPPHLLQPPLVCEAPQP
jgi:hypothetical protein